jgi:hypothetical protein
MRLPWNDHEHHRAADRRVDHERSDYGDRARRPGTNQAANWIDDGQRSVAGAPANRSRRRIALALLYDRAHLQGIARMHRRIGGRDVDATEHATNVSRSRHLVGRRMTTDREGCGCGAGDNNSHNSQYIELPNAEVQLQRIPIRVRAKRAHNNSDPLSAATFVRRHSA